MPTTSTTYQFPRYSIGLLCPVRKLQETQLQDYLTWGCLKKSYTLPSRAGIEAGEQQQYMDWAGFALVKVALVSNPAMLTRL